SVLELSRLRCVPAADRPCGQGEGKDLGLQFLLDLLHMCCPREFAVELDAKEADAICRHDRSVPDAGALWGCSAGSAEVKEFAFGWFELHALAAGPLCARSVSFLSATCGEGVPLGACQASG